jgi:hypothetical protein
MDRTEAKEADVIELGARRPPWLLSARLRGWRARLGRPPRIAAVAFCALALLAMVAVLVTNGRSTSQQTSASRTQGSKAALAAQLATDYREAMGLPAEPLRPLFNWRALVERNTGVCRGAVVRYNTTASQLTRAQLDAAGLPRSLDPSSVCGTPSPSPRDSQAAWHRFIPLSRADLRGPS